MCENNKRTVCERLSERITLKMTQDIKSLLERAAEVSNLSLNAHIVNHANVHSDKVLTYKHAIELNDFAWATLKRAINHPKPASEALKKLMAG